MVKRIGYFFVITMLLTVGCEEASSSDDPTTGPEANGEGGTLFIDPDASIGTGGAEQVELEGDALDEGFQFATDVSAGLEDAIGNGEEAIKGKMCEGEYAHECEECACTSCADWATACNQVPGCDEIIVCSNQTGCLGPSCFEVCSEVIDAYGGYMGKAADLALKFGACAQTNCLETCLASWGPGSEGGYEEEGGEN